MLDLASLPLDLPVPIDDGACNHLSGKPVPGCSLVSTTGGWLNPADIRGWLVIYCYPMTGRPDTALPPGWDAIPGARGCTPQACAFRDHYHELRQLNTQVYGLSTQSSAYQQEAATRLHLPFALLSDAELAFTQALQLPTFETAGMRLNKRVTLLARDGIIEHYFYPVFPPDRSSEQVIAWLRQNC